MIIKMLGSAAGGGFPQLNCNCANCSDVRQGAPGLRAPTFYFSYFRDLDGNKVCAFHVG